MSSFRVASEKHAYQLLRRQVKQAIKSAQRRQGGNAKFALSCLLCNLDNALQIHPGREVVKTRHWVPGTAQQQTELYAKRKK